MEFSVRYHVALTAVVVLTFTEYSPLPILLALNAVPWAFQIARRVFSRVTSENVPCRSSVLFSRVGI